VSHDDSILFGGPGQQVRILRRPSTAGQLVAEYSTGAAQPNGTSYLTTDHLGSTRLVTDSNGNVRARYDYLPFGEEVPSTQGVRGSVSGYGGTDGTRQKFTQKERDTESGLDYFLARYYSSAQGRFTSPDEFTGGPDDLFDFADDASDNPTLYAELEEPESLNKYQYCYNNPLRHVDGDGHGVAVKNPLHDRGQAGNIDICRCPSSLRATCQGSQELK
jgi:RHS repeat-associated protein